MHIFDDPLYSKLLEATNALPAGRLAIWWEKSVEYLFVSKAVESNWFNLVAPLSGNAEALYGDVILQANSKFYLIEFKRNDESWMDETKKYSQEKTVAARIPDYLSALHELAQQEAFRSHLLIFGEIPSTSFQVATNVDLQLRVAKYVNPLDHKPFDGFEQSEGATKDQFAIYLQCMGQLRQDFQEEQESAGSEGLRYVVAVSGDERKRTIALTLANYFALESNLIAQLSKNQANVYKP